MELNPQLQQKCLSAMKAGRTHAVRLRNWGRRMLVSSMGLAAAIALIVAIGFPPNGNTPVAARTVLAKLAEQVQGDGVLAITFTGVHVDEVKLDGHLQIANESIAGDLNVTVTDDPDGPIVVDASLAISPDKAWILLRRLEIPDPQAQAMIQLLLSPTAPTLVILPDNVLESIELGAEIMPFADIRRFATGEMAQVVREVLASGADLGAISEPQPDGTTRVTLHVKNVEVLRRLLKLAAAAANPSDDAEIEISDDDASELIGCTLAVTYDPQTQAVRSFSITDVADMKGTITIGLYEGGMDPAWLDSSRVTTPDTRTLDTGFLKGIIDSATK